MRLSIVSYLDSASSDEVSKLQRRLSEITGSKASLELWMPHVTVGDGIEVNDEELLQLQAELKNIVAKFVPFTVDLRDILKLDSRRGGEGEITTPYGLYLDVNANDNLLNLVASVATASRNLNKWYIMPQPYHPHCTLAFKDLSKEGFERGIAFLDKQSLKLTATLDHVALVEMLPNAARELARFNFTK